MTTLDRLGGPPARRLTSDMEAPAHDRFITAKTHSGLPAHPDQTATDEGVAPYTIFSNSRYLQ
jgi:hypothetical protein